MNTLYLHVGTHKTGTTTIQNSLRANEAYLKENFNLYYPDISIVSEHTHYAHHEVFHSIVSRSNKLTLEQTKQFFQIVESNLDKHNVLLSAEPIYRYLSDTEQSSVWESKEKVLSLIASYLPNNCDVKIIIYLRQPDKFARSMYSEHVMATRYLKSFEGFLSEFWYHFDYQKNIEIFQKVFNAEIIVRYFDKSYFFNGDLIDDFYNIFSIKTDDILKINDKNISVPRFYVESMRVLNAVSYSKKTLRKFRKIFEKYSAEMDFDTTPSLISYQNARTFNSAKMQLGRYSYNGLSSDSRYHLPICLFLSLLMSIDSDDKVDMNIKYDEIISAYLSIFGNKDASSNEVSRITATCEDFLEKCGNKRLLEVADILFNYNLYSVAEIFYKVIYQENANQLISARIISCLYHQNLFMEVIKFHDAHNLGKYFEISDWSKMMISDSYLKLNLLSKSLNIYESIKQETISTKLRVKLKKLGHAIYERTGS